MGRKRKDSSKDMKVYRRDADIRMNAVHARLISYTAFVAHISERSENA